MATHILKLKTHTCKNNIAFKTNTWEKYSLLVLRGLIDSINFLWQIGPECSNKKRTCGFSSGVYSPPHESEQNRKLCRIYNELIQQHICFSSLWPRPREHTHTHTHAHMRTQTAAALRALPWLNSKLISLDAGVAAPWAACWTAGEIPVLIASCCSFASEQNLSYTLSIQIKCFKPTNKLIYAAFKVLEPPAAV